MKIVKSILAAVAVAASMTISANAQDLKFAHIDSQKFLSELPEWTAAQTALQEEAKKLSDQMSVMQNELQQKFQEYTTKRDSLPELIRATKEKELQDTQSRIQSFQQLAQQSLSKKESDLLQPIVEKYHKALEEVGKENKFIYIFDTASQVLLYTSEQSVDAAPYVKAKLTK